MYRAIIGFGNAYLLTGDRRFIDPWTRVIDIVNSNARVIEGEKRSPYIHGDNGWYDFKPEPVPWGTLESWFWTMDDKDKARAENHPWASYLEGRDPGYPTRELAQDF
ncbi:MAG: hypothetical protein VYC82_06930 [Verrucomicrobiota bacterium]|nr:hypothetical protein [Verrucomicrobiota bacterium]